MLDWHYFFKFNFWLWNLPCSFVDSFAADMSLWLNCCSSVLFLTHQQRIAQSLKEEHMKSQESTFSDVELEDPTGRRNSNLGLYFQIVMLSFSLFLFLHIVMFSPFLLMPVVEASSPRTSISPADLHGMWYPTVRRTLVCLSKLYRCIDVSPQFLISLQFTVFSLKIWHVWCIVFHFFISYAFIYIFFCDLVFFQRTVFQGLSQEALSACIQSLLSASDIILKNKVGTYC